MLDRASGFAYFSRIYRHFADCSARHGQNQSCFSSERQRKGKRGRAAKPAPAVFSLHYQEALSGSAPAPASLASAVCSAAISSGTLSSGILKPEPRLPARSSPVPATRKNGQTFRRSRPFHGFSATRHNWLRYSCSNTVMAFLPWRPLGRVWRWRLRHGPLARPGPPSRHTPLSRWCVSAYRARFAVRRLLALAVASASRSGAPPRRAH